MVVSVFRRKPRSSKKKKLEKKKKKKLHVEKKLKGTMVKLRD